MQPTPSRRVARLLPLRVAVERRPFRISIAERWTVFQFANVHRARLGEFRRWLEGGH
jgi:hypothetical protein